MIKPVEIKGVLIGEGMTKIIVPIVAETRDEIVQKARELAKLPIHMVEWRADYYTQHSDTAKLTQTLMKLKDALDGMALLFTLRTASEGGKSIADGCEYISILRTAAKCGAVDAIDVQMLMDEKIINECVRIAHNASIPVIGSNHEFSSTPSKDEIIERLKRMSDMGADILKLAVMPRNQSDVLTLLSATNDMRGGLTTKPMITVSMSGIGSVSRICGEVFGSAMTFASVGDGSAPGQIPLSGLISALTIIHNAL